MVFTVNSNTGAFAALQNKSKASQQQEARREGEGGARLGIRKAEPEDRAVSVGAGAGDLGGLGGVKAALDRASAAIDAAGAAADKVADVLDQLQLKAQEAQREELDSADREALNDEFVALRNTVPEIIDGAEFDGVNAVASGARPIVAVVNETADRVLSVPAQDLSLGGPNVRLGADQTIADAESATAAAEAIAQSRENVDQARYALSDGSDRVNSQRSFVEKLSTTIDEGIGNLVDTGMETETANLQALQVKQQLGLQSLSIANQSPQSILSLLK